MCVLCIAWVIFYILQVICLLILEFFFNFDAFDVIDKNVQQFDVCAENVLIMQTVPRIIAS